VPAADLWTVLGRRYLVEPFLETNRRQPSYDRTTQDDATESQSNEEACQRSGMGLTESHSLAFRCEMARHARGSGATIDRFTRLTNLSHDKEATAEDLALLEASTNTSRHLRNCGQRKLKRLLGRGTPTRDHLCGRFGVRAFLMELAKVEQAAQLIAKAR